jgi:hypothetical protein
MRLGLEEIENLAGDANIVIIEPAETLKPPGLFVLDGWVLRHRRATTRAP